MPLMQGLRVGQSRIHGYGIFTTQSFRQGELLLLGDGVLFRADDKFDDTYALITPGYESGTDGTEGPPMFWDLACQSRWINHSCDPNSVVDTKWIQTEQRVEAWWTASRDIHEGEELAYDYAFSGEIAEICACGTLRCRGLIVDEDEVHLVPDALRHHLNVPKPPLVSSKPLGR